MHGWVAVQIINLFGPAVSFVSYEFSSPVMPPELAVTAMDILMGVLRSTISVPTLLIRYKSNAVELPVLPLS